jgi:hypothetical protein
MPGGKSRSTRDLLGYVLRRDLRIDLEQELRDHERHALGRHRGERVEAGHGVDRLLDLLRHVRLDRERRCARVRRDDRDEREVDLRELVDAERAVADEPDDDEHEDQHRREDGPPDADLG